MDAFSLMKFWRNTAGGDGGGGELNGEDTHSVANASVASRIDRLHAVDDEVDADESFIDFEFIVADYDDKKEKYVAARNAYSGSIGENQKEKDDSVDQKSRSTISFFKSSPKLRVFMLFKKSKSDAISVDDHSSAAPTTTTTTKTTPNHFNQRRSEQSKGGFAVKCRVEEIPIISFIARVNSWRDKSQIKDGTKGYPSSNRSSYGKLLKPLYLKRFTDKATFSSHEADPHTPWKSEKQEDRPAVPKLVCKYLGLSRLSSPAADRKKKDDYSPQLQQDDGIQSAILHCKRSYSSKRREAEVSPSADHGLISS